MDIGFVSFFGFIPLLIYTSVIVLGIYISILFIRALHRTIRALHRTIRWLDLSIREKESRNNRMGRGMVREFTEAPGRTFAVRPGVIIILRECG
ncbi:hypothetical protein WJ0W_002592 [Paenibacillus melissococcoides]|uniref:Uncharacterized protein n=1 Tax=Paenibacillus melissococcoides TaxID=2912268 RepID=A0ABN8U6K1_9BACL|nr:MULTISPECIES: hypothetical protein [Paenibacillus]MEB9893979.1 hypothetical protein [Bacillus cereus]CAH8245357.1 hypothetical protein WJ0W_002592 [Paenibacillus melissococcoides]CAH8710732.1 hypothetical protein WDD9_002672 [Paenibacillus melissococcoides]CAH8711505.1 hypothetical protein HTL2_002973 [Paenibacillus melissococcoides]GIO77819.1 hypothetical protein J6TS7_14290 [Paenibacillus dendritiformis]